MNTLSQAIALVEELNKQVNWGQSADPTLCRLCGGDIPHQLHAPKCLKGQVDDFLNEEYQRRADFGPYGDATTPGFFKTS